MEETGTMEAEMPLTKPVVGGSRPVRTITSAFSRVVVAALFTLAAGHAIAADALWVEDPHNVAVSIADLTAAENALGLTRTELSDRIAKHLESAGLGARQPEIGRDTDILFLDVVVEGGTFYASLGFMRTASYQLPNSRARSEYLPVWREYAIGEHHGSPQGVYETVDRIIDGFILAYDAANNRLPSISARN